MRNATPATTKSRNEIHAREIHAHEVHAYGIHVYEAHPHEMHACEAHAHEVHAHLRLLVAAGGVAFLIGQLGSFVSLLP
jgi:hypothetical protein